jgi:hypothetical protein
MPIRDITFKNRRKSIMRLLRPVIAAAALLVGVQAQATSYVFHIYSPGIRAVANASPPSTTYATLNPSDMGSSAALWNGNLTDISSLGTGVRGTIGKSSGKWYFEMTVNSTENGFAPCVGIASSATPLSNSAWVSGPGEFTYYGMWNGQLIYGSGTRAAYGGNSRISIYERNPGGGHLLPVHFGRRQRDLLLAGNLEFRPESVRLSGPGRIQFGLVSIAASDCRRTDGLVLANLTQTKPASR